MKKNSFKNKGSYQTTRYTGAEQKPFQLPNNFPISTGLPIYLIPKITQIASSLDTTLTYLMNIQEYNGFYYADKFTNMS